MKRLDFKKIERIKGECIYYFYDKNRVLLYIESTNDLSRRVNAHLNDKWWFWFVKYYDVVKLRYGEERYERENFMIAQLRPIFNSIGQTADHTSVIEAYKRKILKSDTIIDFSESVIMPLIYKKTRKKKKNLDDTKPPKIQYKFHKNEIKRDNKLRILANAYRPTAKVDGNVVAREKIDITSGPIRTNIGISYIKKSKHYKPYTVQVIYYNDYGQKCVGPSKSFHCLFQAIKWRNNDVEKYRTVMPADNPFK